MQCTADVRLCFRIGKNPVFYDAAHMNYKTVLKAGKLVSGQGSDTNGKLPKFSRRVFG